MSPSLPLLLIYWVRLALSNFFLNLFFCQPDNKRHLGSGIENKCGEKQPRNASNSEPYI